MIAAETNLKFPRIISASAGSGKTYTITEELFNKIDQGETTPEKVIATTFTVKAANELKSRIREKLIEKGKTREANQMNQALIGTINSICLKLLKNYAFEAGISPMVETLDQNDSIVVLREILGSIIDDEYLELAYKLYQSELNNPFAKRIPYLSQIEKIISKIRLNDLSLDQVNDFAEASVKEYLGNYKGINIDHESARKKVIELLEKGFENIHPELLDASPKKQFIALQNQYFSIKNDSFTWHDWVTLNKIDLADKHFDHMIKSDIKKYVSCLLNNSKFREDYSAYIHKSFAYAKEAIEQYQRYKAEKRVLDFTDQEALLYKLIKENPEVAEHISKTYNLVIIDEFQDVSPLQLSLFMKLTQLTDDSIWVGDPKQSIYAFRDADPILMKGMMKLIPENKRHQLGRSFRSRASLINFSNAVFSEAFSELLSQDEIVLRQGELNITGRAENEDELLTPAISYWDFYKDFKGRAKKSLAWDALSVRIHKLLSDPPPVFDKESKTYRPARFGDISILCRSNFECRSINKCLGQAGIPVAAATHGIIFEPEVVFISALLKLLAYPHDTLAKAEVLLYSKFGGDQAAMIDDRLDFESVKEWGKGNKYIAKLNEYKPRLFNDSPSVTIEKLLSLLQLEELFASWGDVNQRLSNVDAYIFHASEYQQTCKRLKSAATITGFLSWMEDLNETEEDKSGVQYGDVLKVMTYHQSKGLEWPIVILWNLDFPPKDRFYGVNIYSGPDFDPTNPLKGRELRLTIKPFNKSSIESYNEIIDNSEQKRDAVIFNVEEEKRLFYVAATRARDYLVMTRVNAKLTVPKLISTHLDQFGLQDGIGDSSISFDGRKVRVQKESIGMLKEYDLKKLSTGLEHKYFPPSKGRGIFEIKRINPSSRKPVSTATTGELISIGPSQTVNRKGIADSELGTVIHNLIAVYPQISDDAKWEQLVADRLFDFEMQDALNVKELANYISTFYTYIKNEFKPFIIHNELPFQGHMKGGQSINGYVDMLIETDEHLIIIDHKTVSKDSDSAYKEKALEFSGQLQLYKDCLEKSFKKKVASMFIHFIFAGRMLELK